MVHKFQVCEPLTEEEREALKASIAEHGVRVPVEVDEEGNILDGHNRFDIARELGVPCPITVKNGLQTDDDKRAYARELNCARRQMTIEAKKKIAREMIRENPERSSRSVARAVGIDHKTVISLREKLGLAGESGHNQSDEAEEEKPVHEWLKRDGWKTWHQMEALSYLGQLGDEEQAVIDAILNQRSRPPREALRILETAARFSEPDRARMLELWERDNDMARALVVSKLVGVEPMPDPALPALSAAIDTCREISRIVKDEDRRARLARVRSELCSIQQEVEESMEVW